MARGEVVDPGAFREEVSQGTAHELGEDKRVQYGGEIFGIGDGQANLRGVGMVRILVAEVEIIGRGPVMARSPGADCKGEGQVPKVAGGGSQASPAP